MDLNGKDKELTTIRETEAKACVHWCSLAVRSRKRSVSIDGSTLGKGLCLRVFIIQDIKDGNCTERISDSLVSIYH